MRGILDNQQYLCQLQLERERAIRTIKSTLLPNGEHPKEGEIEWLG